MGGADDSPLALAGVFAIVTEVDGSGAASWQQGIIGSQDGTPQNLQVLLVAGHAHPHMVRQPHLQANNMTVVSTVCNLGPTQGAGPVG